MQQIPAIKPRVTLSASLLCLLPLLTIPSTVEAAQASKKDAHVAHPKQASVDKDQLIAQLLKKTEALESKVVALTAQVDEVESEHKHYKKEGLETTAQNIVRYTRGAPVTTSPYIGNFDEYRGQKLFAKISDINEDYELLAERKILNKRAKDLGIPEAEHAVVDFSGVLDVSAYRDSSYIGHHVSDVNLNQSELDFAAEVASWATAFISINYDNGLLGSASRIANSRLFIDKAFLVIGDTDKTPFYLSAGQMYVPFGNYGSYMVSDPLVQALGKTNARAINLGYHQQSDDALYANVYAFQGDSREGAYMPNATSRSRNDIINNWGVNLGYVVQKDKLKAEIRAGYINNMADAQGMQFTPSQGFGGFAQSSVAEVLERDVHGLSLFGTLIYDHFDLRAEYARATDEFSPLNMTYDSHGAQPSAYHVEGAYNFTTWNKPSSFALGYDHTIESLALGLPKHRYLAAFNINPSNDVLMSLEVRHDQNYGSSSYATGAGMPIGGANQLGEDRTRVTGFVEYQF